MKRIYGLGQVSGDLPQPPARSGVFVPYSNAQRVFITGSTLPLAYISITKYNRCVISGSPADDRVPPLRGNMIQVRIYLSGIAIRTAVLKDDTLHIQAGAGVVYDSIPELEWKETMNKARAIFKAVSQAAAGLDGAHK